MLRFVPLLLLLAGCGPTTAELRTARDFCHVWAANGLGDQPGITVFIEDGVAVWDRGLGIHAKSSYFVSPTRIGIDNGVRVVEYATVDYIGLLLDRWSGAGTHAMFEAGVVKLPDSFSPLVFNYSNVCSVSEAALGTAELLRSMGRS